MRRGGRHPTPAPKGLMSDDDKAKTPQKAVTRQSELDAGRIEEDFCRVVGCGSQKTLLPLALHFGTLNPSRLV